MNNNTNPSLPTLYSDGGGVLNSGKIKIQGTSGKSYNLDDFSRLSEGVKVQFAPTDLNTCLTAGFYRLQDDHTNAAFGRGNFGQLLVIYGGADTIAQLEFQYASTTFALRVGNVVNNSGGIWQPWRII